MNPFDYVNSILQNKKNIIVDQETENNYSPFLVNRSLSYHKDCLIYANEMNRRHFIDKKMQYDFLINTVRSQKRSFVKWVKSEKNDDLRCLMDVYGFSEKKAREVFDLISKEELEQLKQKSFKGGTVK
jgi:hypothetical protein